MKANNHNQDFITELARVREARLAHKATLEDKTKLTPDAPAPHLKALAEATGTEPTRRALAAWDQRVAGSPIVDVAAQLGVSIESARALIREAHAAVFEDLKANLELNRSIDLARVDNLIKAYYSSATTDKNLDDAQFILKCLAHRAKLCGTDPDHSLRPSATPTNVLVWIQSQLPTINRIVDSLPPEMLPVQD